MGGDGYPPPGPLSCPTCGSEQSGPGRWSKSTPSPCTPQLDTPCNAPPKGRTSYTSGDLQEVGVGGSLSILPSPHCTEPADVSPVTLPLGPIFTQDSRCAGVVFPNGSSLHSLSVGRTPLYSAPLWHDRVDTPYLPYYPCWYLSTPNQITLSGRGNPVAASLHLWKREGHYWHISMPTSSGSPFKTLWT